MLTYKRMLLMEMEEEGDRWDNIESMTLTKDQLKEKFPISGTSFIPFFVFTEERVYFPQADDFSVDIYSVPRDKQSITPKDMFE